MRKLKFFAILAMICCVVSCNSKKDNYHFTLKGEISHAANQKVYLEELFFSDKNPEVLDTGMIINGKFTVQATATEEGLYRLRLEKSEVSFIFINDEANIECKADIRDTGIEGASFNTPANDLLKTFMVDLNNKITDLDKQHATINLTTNDSLLLIAQEQMKKLENGFKTFISNKIDTCKDPIVTMFALGYSNVVDTALLNKTIAGLTKRFPQHKGIETVVASFTKMKEARETSSASATGKPAIGNMAPDLNLPDTAGVMFSLSQLKGQYVLVDFWASWCGPCRGENPYVVAAYRKFKKKNFTVLGVSLDENKADWKDAIKEDQLTWKHIIDLRGWNGEAAKLYGFDGIPYNVLVDPQGKIIATDLREEALEAFLSKTLQ